MNNETYDVIIAGCGPSGAVLAAELRLHEVNVLVLERDTEPAPFTRIVGVHVRSLELLATRGLLEGLLAHGRKRPAAGLFAAISKPAAPGPDSTYGYLLGIPQPVIVRLLEEHALRLGAGAPGLRDHRGTAGRAGGQGRAERRAAPALAVPRRL